MILVLLSLIVGLPRTEKRMETRIMFLSNASLLCYETNKSMPMPITMHANGELLLNGVLHIHIISQSARFCLFSGLQTATVVLLTSKVFSKVNSLNNNTYR